MVLFLIPALPTVSKDVLKAAPILGWLPVTFWGLGGAATALMLPYLAASDPYLRSELYTAWCFPLTANAGVMAASCVASVRGFALLTADSRRRLLIAGVVMVLIARAFKDLIPQAWAGTAVLVLDAGLASWFLYQLRPRSDRILYLVMCLSLVTTSAIDASFLTRATHLDRNFGTAREVSAAFLAIATVSGEYALIVGLVVGVASLAAWPIPSPFEPDAERRRLRWTLIGFVAVGIGSLVVAAAVSV